MFKSLFLILSMFIIAGTSHAGIFKSFDSEKNCTSYEIVNKVRNDNGENVYERSLSSGEEILTDKGIYGLSLKEVEIDFDTRSASFKLIKNVILGLNRPLLVTGARVTVDSSHKSFKNIINLVNKKISLIESICLSDSLEIIEVRLD
jgi:hypothetical protein